jgi:hypothetical protein
LAIRSAQEASERSAVVTTSNAISNKLFFVSFFLTFVKEQYYNTQVLGS